MKTKNLTISLDQDLITAGKRYAKLKGSSINELFRDFLKKNVIGEQSNTAADDLIEALDSASINSAAVSSKKKNPGNKRSWSREDAYSR